MKKLISIILTAGILLTGTMAYAEEAAGNKNGKVNAVKGFVNDVKPQLETIKENRKILNELRQEATDLYKSTKKKINDLLKSKEEISQAQIEAVKQSVDLLVSDKKLLAETKGDIYKNSVDLKVARKAKNSEAYKAALDEIIKIQTERIKTLSKVIEDLKSIENI